MNRIPLSQLAWGGFAIAALSVLIVLGILLVDSGEEQPGAVAQPTATTLPTPLPEGSPMVTGECPSNNELRLMWPPEDLPDESANIAGSLDPQSARVLTSICRTAGEAAGTVVVFMVPAAASPDRGILVLAALPKGASGLHALTVLPGFGEEFMTLTYRDLD